MLRHFFVAIGDGDGISKAHQVRWLSKHPQACQKRGWSLLCNYNDVGKWAVAQVHLWECLNYACQHKGQWEITTYHLTARVHLSWRSEQCTMTRPRKDHFGMTIEDGIHTRSSGSNECFPEFFVNSQSSTVNCLDFEAWNLYVAHSGTF